MAKANEVYTKATDKIIEALEQGIVPWSKPWRDVNQAHAGKPHNPFSSTVYQGGNAFVLAFYGALAGYTHQAYGTFKQIKDAGLKLRKGATADYVVFYAPLYESKNEAAARLGTDVKNVTKQDRKQKGVYPKTWAVFNLSQHIEWSSDAERHHWLGDDFEAGSVDIPAFNDIMTAWGNELQINIAPSNMAFYSPSQDFINLPDPAQFDDPDEFVEVALHELAHATGHESRLNRHKGSACGSSEYAFEELVAEVASAATMTTLGIEPDYTNKAAYIDGWLKAFKGKDGRKKLYRSFTQAFAAADMILEVGGCEGC